MSLRAVLVLVSTALIGFAQSPVRPEFDVATVKLSPPPSGDSIVINLGRAVNGKVDLSNATLSDCIKFAYGIASDAQLAVPEWINSRGTIRFDIVGQAPADTPRERLLLMLQTLLTDRLRLVLHREIRELSYLALTVGRNGPKLPPSTADPATPTGPVFPGRMISPAMTMETLAMLLSRFEQQTVLDKTGLPGRYEVKLEWTSDRLRNLPPGPGGAPPQTNGQPIDLAGPSLYTAVQEQLGLKLESRKGPVEVLVVDSADKTPSEN